MINMEKSVSIGLITLICAAIALVLMTIGLTIVIGMNTDVQNSILGTLIWMREFGYV